MEDMKDTKHFALYCANTQRHTDPGSMNNLCMCVCVCGEVGWHVKFDTVNKFMKQLTLHRTSTASRLLVLFG